MLPLGFASGLPLALTGGTLQAWLSDKGFDISTIGLFTIVSLPYTLKFLWSPLMDRYSLPFLGRRRGWMLVTQLLLTVAIFAMALSDPLKTPLIIAIIAFFLAFTSASQDIVFDAYRTDLLNEKERGLGVGVTVTGYRIAMLVSGSLALIFADHIGWHVTYLLLALIMGSALIATFISPEPDNDHYSLPTTLSEAIYGPLKNFFSRKGAILFLVLVVLYKLGDAFAGTLTTAFLLKGPGFSLTDVGTINKGLGLCATLGGALAGGALMSRMSLYGSLMTFGIMQAVSNLSFMLVAIIGKSYPAMIFAIGFENLSGGMGTSAFVALIMAACDKRYSATQYALLTSMASLARVFAGPPSGYIVETTGWTIFFLLTTFAAFPGLILLFFMRNRLREITSS